MSGITGLAAVIGIGSNSVRLLISEVSKGRIRAVERGEDVTRLAGFNITSSGRPMLTADAMRDTVEAALTFAARVGERGASLRAIIATQAVRASANGEELTGALQRELGLPVEVISGDEEATLGWLAASSSTPADTNTALCVIDIGGGSSDLSAGLVGEARPVSVASLEAGGRTVMHRFSLNRAIDRTKLMGLVSALTVELGYKVTALRPRPQIAVVIGGTASVLAKLHTAEKEGAPHIEAGWLDAQLKELSLLDSAGRIAMGVPADRADIIVAGSAILLTILNIWGIAHFYTSESNILDGYLQKSL